MYIRVELSLHARIIEIAGLCCLESSKLQCGRALRLDNKLLLFVLRYPICCVPQQ